MNVNDRQHLFDTSTSCAFCDSETYDLHRSTALNGVVCEHCYRNVTVKYNPQFVEIYTGNQESIAVYAYQSENNDSFRLFSDENKPLLVFTEPEVKFHSLSDQLQEWIKQGAEWDFIKDKEHLPWENATDGSKTYFQRWGSDQDNPSKGQVQAIRRKIEPPTFVTQNGLYANSVNQFKKTKSTQQTIV